MGGGSMGVGEAAPRQLHSHNKSRNSNRATLRTTRTSLNLWLHSHIRRTKANWLHRRRRHSRLGSRPRSTRPAHMLRIWPAPKRRHSGR